MSRGVKSSSDIQIVDPNEEKSDKEIHYSDLEKFNLVLTSAQAAAIGRVIGDLVPKGNNPRDFPPQAMAAMLSAPSIFNSYNNAAIQLSDPKHWARLREDAMDAECPVELGLKPPTRYHLAGVRDLFATNPAYLRLLADVARVVFAEQVKAMGLGLPGRERHFANPPMQEILYGDATHVSHRFNLEARASDSETPSRRVRKAISEAQRHRTGDKRDVLTKLIVSTAQVATGFQNERVVVDFEPNVEGHREPATIIEILRRIVAQELQFTVYSHDMALTGSTIARILRLGMAACADLRSGKGASPRIAKIPEPFEFDSDGHPCRHLLFVRDSIVCYHPSPNMFKNLQWSGTKVQGVAPTARGYVTWRGPCDLRAGVFHDYRIPILGEPLLSLDGKKWVRAEHIRAYPTTIQPGKSIRNRGRSFAEGEYRTLDRTLDEGRAHSLEDSTQFVEYIGHALQQDVIAGENHRRRLVDQDARAEFDRKLAGLPLRINSALDAFGDRVEPLRSKIAIPDAEDADDGEG